MEEGEKLILETASDMANDFIITNDIEEATLHENNYEHSYSIYIVQLLGLFICIYGIEYFKRYGFLFTLIITLNYFLGTSQLLELLQNNITLSIITIIISSLIWRKLSVTLVRLSTFRKLFIILSILTIFLLIMTIIIDYFFYDFEYFFGYLYLYLELFVVFTSLQINPLLLLTSFVIFGGTYLMIGEYFEGYVCCLIVFTLGAIFCAIQFQTIRVRRRRYIQPPEYIDHKDLFNIIYLPIRNFFYYIGKKIPSFSSILYLFFTFPPFVPILSFYLSYLYTGTNIYENFNIIPIIENFKLESSSTISQIDSIFLIFLNISMLWTQFSWNFILFTSSIRFTLKSKRLFAIFWTITILPLLICILWSIFNSVSSNTKIRILICWISILFDTLLPRCEISQFKNELSKHYRKLTNKPSRTMNQNDAKRLMTKLAKNSKTSLNTSNTSSSDDHSCVVCMERDREVVFECGHFICCEICAKDCITNQQICPLCRANSSTYIKVWR